jgi:hypothetical protein
MTHAAVETICFRIDKAEQRMFTLGAETHQRSQLRRDPIHKFLFGRNGMSFVARRLAACSAAIILIAAGVGSALAAGVGSALAQKKYDTGATDTEIKIVNIMTYSGPFAVIMPAGFENAQDIDSLAYLMDPSDPKILIKSRKFRLT